MKPQAKPKNNDLLKRVANLPPMLDLLIAFPLAGYAGYVLHAGDGSRMFGFMAIAAAFCFAGLGINAVMRNMRELKVLEQYSQPGLITKLDEPKFERMLRALYTTRGYMIEEPGEHQEDPGYDFILSRAKERILVRTRDWVEDKVPLSTLKKVWNAKRPVKANGIIIVTNGAFAEDALEWGRRQNVEMLTGKDIEAAVLAEVSGGQEGGTGKASKKEELSSGGCRSSTILGIPTKCWADAGWKGASPGCGEQGRWLAECEISTLSCEPSQEQRTVQTCH